MVGKKPDKAIEPTVQDAIDDHLRIPIKYWYPTIVAVISFTVTGVWWFFNQLAPLDARIAKLESVQHSPFDADRILPFLKIKHLQGVGVDGSLSKAQSQVLSNVAFELNNERRDLVLIVTGYTGKGAKVDKAESVKASEQVAQKMRERLMALGIGANRIFAKGYGSDVPDFFESSEPLNAAVMECDVLVLMKYFARG